MLFRDPRKSGGKSSVSGTFGVRRFMANQKNNRSARKPLNCLKIIIEKTERLVVFMRANIFLNAFWSPRSIRNLQNINCGRTRVSVEKSKPYEITKNNLRNSRGRGTLLFSSSLPLFKKKPTHDVQL